MKLLRPLRLVGTVPTALFLYRHRRSIAEVLRFGATVPERLRAGRIDDLALDARARFALLSDPELRGAPIAIRSVEGKRIVLEGDLGDPRLDRARRLLQDLGQGVDVVVSFSPVDADARESAPVGAVSG